MEPNASFPATTAQSGESLVASLCWEMERLRRRAAQVVAGLERCQDPRLFERLRQELRQLIDRRDELKGAVAEVRRHRGGRHGLALALLEELTRRPLVSA